MSEKWPIDKIKVGERFRKDLGNIEELAANIKEEGLYHPIVITSSGDLVIGRRRLKAYELLGEKEIPVNVLDLDSPIKSEYTENVMRKDFTPSEKVAIWQALESRQGQLRSDSEQTYVKPIQQAAKMTGIGTDTLSKAKQVVEAAEENPIEFVPIQEEMDKTGNVNAAYQQVIAKKEPNKAKSKKERITIEFPPDLIKYVDQYAKETGSKRDNVIHTAVREWLDSKRQALEEQTEARDPPSDF